MSAALDRCEILPDAKSSGDIRKTAERIANSQAFGRSDQLRRLLLHLCKQTLAGNRDQLHEQQIGVDVFGRSRDYDPSIDGIVRTHATRLRQRLELYFSQEGANEPIHIEVPRGGYVPRFYEHVDACNKVETTQADPTLLVTKEQNVSTAVLQAQPIEKPQSKWPGRAALYFLFGMLITLTAVGLAIHVRQDSIRNAQSGFAEQTDVERRFWSIIFPEKQQTRIITGDSGLVLYESVIGREVSLSEYLTGTYRGKALALLNGPDLTKEQIARNLGDRRYTSEVDLQISAAISKLPEWASARDQIIFARDLRPPDVSSSNLVLLGSRQADPWVSMLEPSINFRLQRKPNSEFYYLNAAPKAGEQPRYEAQAEPNESGAPVTYGDVAFFANPSGSGVVLALGGLWVSGTEAAGRFVLSGNAFSDWLRSIERKDGSIPSFEILIASHSLEGSATRTEIVAQRVMP